MLNKEEDVHVLTGTLKLFLRELSDPIIPSELNKEFMSAISKSNIRLTIRIIFKNRVFFVKINECGSF